MNSTDRINAFAKLGEILLNPDPEKFHGFGGEIIELNHLISSSMQTNGWFTHENVSFAIKSLGQSLERFHLERWCNNYQIETFERIWDTVVGVVMAGNIPLVGFHDYLCVMITGNKLLGKLSSDDNKLLPTVHKILSKIEPEFTDRAEFTEGKLENFDAIIATGSNNTARYFEYYFAKYPHIIRKNRNGIAVITSNESNEELSAIGRDIFSYFGLGCRNVSKVYIPQDYKFDGFFEAIENYRNTILHHKYANNYDYNKSIFLVNSVPHFDNGFLLITENTSIPSPISVLHYETYNDINQLNNELLAQQDSIQCLVSTDQKIKGALHPGETQKPNLWDYADDVDTLEFLSSLNE